VFIVPGGCHGDVTHSPLRPLLQVCESGGAEQRSAGAEDAPRSPHPGAGGGATGAGPAAPDAADRHVQTAGAEVGEGQGGHAL